MKLYSPDAELKAIRTITTSSELIAALVMSSIDVSFFHYPPCAAAFERLSKLARTKGRIVSYSDLLSDLALHEDFRDLLREAPVARCKSIESAESLIQTLDNFRIARTLYGLSKHIVTTMKGSDVDVHKLLDETTDTLTIARTNDRLAQQVRILGKDANAKDLLAQALSMEDDILFKTGIDKYDNTNGGLPSEGVFIAAATTSGGKSTFLMNLLKNMHQINMIDVCNVSLEMNDKKQTRRLLSHLTQIPLAKFLHKRLTDEDRALAKKMWIRFNKFGKDNSCRYAMLNPDYAVTMQQLLMLLKPYGFKVIGIDYISLLDGIDAKDQWRALGEIVRQAKIFSTANKCLIVLLAQLDSDDDHIRYSKAMLEHADNAWIWNYTKPEQRELKIIPIRQLKARDQELFNFELQEKFEVMTLCNLDTGSDDGGNPKAAAVDVDEDVDISYENTGAS